MTVRETQHTLLLLLLGSSLLRRNYLRMGRGYHLPPLVIWACGLMRGRAVV
mgnify:CR=1 FL=1